MSDERKNGIVPVPLEDEMRRSYLDYAMSVIVARALPDVRDGMKPVQRRIIYSMNENGNHADKPHRKSARITGDVTGKYHPHGRDAVYDTMVRMAQDFSLRVPLIDGQGNFGSMDGDSAAADRYTEARMSVAAHEMVADIDCDTVEWVPNYDGQLTEPAVLPARFPNLLVNGASGIAVGLATNIPTHNLCETVDACIALLDNPTISVEELMKILPGPDFPTGGIIMGNAGIRSAYVTGKGSVVIRSKTEIVKSGHDRESIIVSEIPYQVNKARMVERIAELVKNKTVEGISDIRDESNKDGVRVVIDIKREGVAEVILNQLFKYTPLQSSFGYNILAIVNGHPRQLGIRDLLIHFIEFRKNVVIRRTRFLLRKAKDKTHILLGFTIAVGNIDLIIEMIKSSKDRAEAKNKLMTASFNIEDIIDILRIVDGDVPNTEQYRLTEIQADAILDLRLHKLTGLERDKISDDLNELVAKINEYMAILRSKDRVVQIVKDELQEVRNKFPSKRLTVIEQSFESVDTEDLIQKEDMVITTTVEGYIKRVPLATYRTQKRGGKGRNGMETKDTDIVSNVIVANTHDDILFFSSIGKVYKMRVYKLPLAGPAAKGRAVVNLLPVSDGEKISTILVVKDDDKRQNKTFVFATSFGNVRRNKFEDFANIQANGKKAIQLDDGEQLVSVALCSDDDDIFLATESGICNRFNVTDVRVFSGRDSNGVRGIRLNDDDRVVSMNILSKWQLDGIEEREEYLKNAEQLRKTAKRGLTGPTLIEDKMTKLAFEEELILTITENGFGKVSSCYEYRPTSRGTKGFTNIAITEKNGNVVASFPVKYDDNIMLITTNGRIMRCSVEDIRITRRSSQGVIILRMDEGEIISSVSIVDETQEADDMEDGV